MNPHRLKIIISILLLVLTGLGVAATFSNKPWLLGFCLVAYLVGMALLWYIEWLERKRRWQ